MEGIPRDNRVSKRREFFLMEGNIIKMVKQFNYLGTEAESKGTMDAEDKKRIGTVYAAYKKFDKVTFSNKHLRLKKKLEMFARGNI